MVIVASSTLLRALQWWHDIGGLCSRHFAVIRITAGVEELFHQYAGACLAIAARQPALGAVGRALEEC
eukprot:2174769-Amphidinium_carterae.1